MKAFAVHMSVAMWALALTACSQATPERTVGDGNRTPTAEGQPTTQTVSMTGVISDGLCGANHAGMLKTGSMGEDDISCTVKCIEAGSPYVLVDAESGEVYRLSDQDKPKQFAGKKVTVTGEVSEKTKFIRVKDLSLASPPSQ